MRKRENLLSKKYFVLLIFTVTAFVVFFSSINSSFHYDDFANITNNPDITINNLSFSTLKKAAFTGVYAGSRPVSYFSFALNYYFSGLDTTSYHVVNILLHALSAFFIYLIILTLFDYDNADDEKKEKLFISSFFTALFWLVAPFNSQSVIYIVQRMTLMMTFFFLLSFLYYVKARKQNKTKYFVLSGVFLLLSFFSKQNALVFPIVVVLYELIFKRGGDLKSISKNEKMIAIVLFVSLLLPLIIFWGHINELFIEGLRSWGFTYYERELTQFRVFVLYFSLMILPLPSRLQLLYDIDKSTSIVSPVTTFLSIIFITVLFIISIMRMKKSPYLSFALLWFFITMSVEAVLPLEMMYEHRLYLPSIFLIGAAVDYATERLYRKNLKVVLAVFCAIAIAYGAMTSIRGKAWESEVTLWTDEVNKNPENPRAHYHLSNSYQKINANSKAEHHLKFALNKWMTSDNVRIEEVSSALNNLGTLQVNLGMSNLATKSFLKALEYKDDWYAPYFNLGIIYVSSGDYKKALSYFKKAVKYNPDDVISIYNLGVCYYTLKDYDNALKTYKKVIRVNSTYSMAYDAIGDVYKDIGNNKIALDYYKKALSYNPNEINIKSKINYLEKHLK